MLVGLGGCYRWGNSNPIGTFTTKVLFEVQFWKRGTLKDTPCPPQRWTGQRSARGRAHRGARRYQCEPCGRFPKGDAWNQNTRQCARRNFLSQRFELRLLLKYSCFATKRTVMRRFIRGYEEKWDSGFMRRYCCACSPGELTMFDQGLLC